MSDAKIEIKLTQTVDEASVNRAAAQVEQSAKAAADSITATEREESQKRIAIAEEEAAAKKRTLAQVSTPPNNDGEERLARALQLMQEQIGRNVASLGDMEAALMQANDRMIETSVHLNGSEEDLDAFGQRMDAQMQKLAGLSAQFEQTAVAAHELVTALSKGDNGNIDDLMTQAEGLKSSYDDLHTKAVELKASVRSLNSDMNEARQSLLEGVFSPAQAEAVAQLNARIAETAAMMRHIKENKVDVVLDTEGNMHSLHDLTQSLEKLHEARKAVSEVGGDVTDWVKKYGDSTKDEVEKIIASYAKLRKEEEKQAEQAAKAAEKQRAAAAEKLKKLQEAAALEASSIEELKSRLAELKTAREDANAVDATVDELKYAEAIKKTSAELDRKTKAQARAAAQAKKEADAQKRAGDIFTQTLAGMIRAAVTGTLTIRGLAAAIRGIGAAIKTGLGPIGWGILLVEGLIFAAQKAWGWAKKLWSDNTKAAEESARRQQEILDNAIKAANEAKEKYEGFVAEQQEKDALDALSGSLEKLNAQLSEKTRKQREALELTLREAALTQEQEELELKLKLAKLEGRRAREEIDEQTYLTEKQKLSNEALIAKQQREKEKLLEEQAIQVSEQNETRTALDTVQKKKSSLGSLNLRSDVRRDADNAMMRSLEEKLARLRREEAVWKRFEGTKNNAGVQKLDEIRKQIKSYEGYIDAYRNKNQEEIQSLRYGGYADLASIMEKQNRTGGSTISAEIEKLRKETDSTEETLQRAVEEQERKIEFLAAEINALPQKHEVQAALQAEIHRLETTQSEQKSKKRKEKERQDESKEEAKRVKEQSDDVKEDAEDTSRQARKRSEKLLKQNKALIQQRAKRRKEQKREKEDVITGLYDEVTKSGDADFLRRLVAELKGDGNQGNLKNKDAKKYGAESIRSVLKLRGEDRDWWGDRFSSLQQSQKLAQSSNALKEAAEQLSKAADATADGVGNMGEQASRLADAYERQLQRTHELESKLEQALSRISTMENQTRYAKKK